MQAALFSLIIAISSFPVDTKVQDELTCLTDNIYYESRGESIKGQYSVAYVTMNRVKDRRFPNTVCEVVYQKRQFAWVGKGYKVFDIDSYTRSYNIAQDVYFNYDVKRDPTGGSLFFESSGVKQKKPVHIRIGNHNFYK